jgi:hypothetical protein
LRFKFWGSCFKVCDFRLVETSIGAPPKHDMFLCWFAPDPAMLVYGNPHWAASKRTTHLRFVRDMMYLCLRKIHSPNFEQLSPFNYLQVWMDLKYLFTFLLRSPISYHKVQAPCYRPKWRRPCLNVGPDKQTGSFFLWVISKTAWYDLGFYQPIVQKIVYLATKDSPYKNNLLELALGWKGPLQVQASLWFSLSRKILA